MSEVNTGIKLPMEVQQAIKLYNPFASLIAVTDLEMDETGRFPVPQSYYYGRVLKREWERTKECPRCHNTGTVKDWVGGEYRDVVCDYCEHSDYGRNVYYVLDQPAVPLPPRLYEKYGSGRRNRDLFSHWMNSGFDDR